MQKSRIVFIVPAFPRISETFIVNQFLELLERGLDIYVFCQESDFQAIKNFPKLRENPEFLSRIHCSKPRFFEPVVFLLLPLIMLRCFLFKRNLFFRYLVLGWKRFGFDVFKKLYLDSKLLLLEPQLIHFHFGALAVGRTYLKELLHCKISASFRGYDLYLSGLEDPNYYQKVWEDTDSIHFLGEALWQKAKERGCPADKEHVFISPAVDLHFFDSVEKPSDGEVGSAQRPLRILSVGRLDWRKGYEYALQAVQLLQKKGVHCEYRIVGDGNYLESASFARYQLGLENNTHFLGAKSLKEIKEEMVWADIFLHAAVSEGFCNAVLEAQAMRLPVVCTDAGGLPENIDNGVTGLLASRRDPKALAEKLERLSKDSILRQEMGSAGRRRVETYFLLEDQNEKFEKFYQENLGENLKSLMCGIAGMSLKSGAKVQESLLKKMGNVQSHRGPDHTGIFMKDSFGFIHTRLSILDLSEFGNQPYANDRYVLVYNGEIYNYLALKDKLIKEGVRFRSTSDTAVLFEHLVRYGVEETLREIRGMFAFSFCDLRDKQVYLCRDRFGIKPLVWKEDSEGFFWASEMKALCAVSDTKPDPVKTLFAATSAGDHSPHYTVFQDVHHVPPGSYVILSPEKKPQKIIYYDPVSVVDSNYYGELDAMPEDQVVSTFENLMEKSIKGMLMSDAPIGAFVSGGIDSSLIAMFAARHQPNFSLFTANVLGKHSEFSNAEYLGNFLKKPLHATLFNAQRMILDWAKTTTHYECPIVTHTNAIPLAAVAALAREHQVKAVLTGEGSDELFLGYPGIHRKAFLEILRMPVNVLEWMYGIVPKIKNQVFSKSSSSINDFLALLTQNFERQWQREEGKKAYSFLPENQIQEHYQSIQMMKEGLLALLHRNDRMGMSASIESRFPFLDEEVVRFALNLPLKWKRKINFKVFNWKHPLITDKFVVRKMASKHLPKKLVSMPKNGFPMYGHKFIQVRSGYFRDGYLADITGLSQRGEDAMLQTQPPYFIAKLVSVDLFGRIFSMNESIDSVSSRLKEHVTLKIL